MTAQTITFLTAAADDLNNIILSAQTNHTNEAQIHR